jgi:F-type H+-transporting ATPase subunit a
VQAVAELGYEFVAGMVRDNAGSEGKAYFPFILTLFVFILFCNTLGLVPYSFTPTSHIIVTFAMAVVVFVGVTIIGFAKHGLHFLQLFAPKGVPVYFLVFVAPLEVFSYFVRPFSLSIRLFANMLAGHTMLKVFGGFAVMLGILAGWAPIVLIFALTGLELIIAFLQAYVFTILTCLYLHDALHPSH